MAVGFFVFGLLWGSFLNVVILRLKAGQAITGRSQCPHCKRQLKWYENVPVVSFVVLGGKCRTCRQLISWQYPLVELVCGILWLVGALYWPTLASSGTLQLWPAVVFGLFASILLTLFVFDARWYILPDEITVSGIVLALLLNGFVLGVGWWPMVVASALGTAWFGWQYAVSRGKWVGSGDIRLGALMGAMLGSWQSLLVALVLAYCLGSAAAVYLLVRKQKGWGSQFPFGTVLTISTCGSLLWGSAIWHWYMGLVW